MNNFLLDSAWSLRGMDADASFADVTLERDWSQDVCRSRLINRGGAPTPALYEAVLFAGDMPFPADTPLYGEGYSMLSQTGGTLEQPRNIGAYTDHGHYKLPEVPGLFTVYNLLLLMPEGAPVLALSFSSCNHYVGALRVSPKRYEISMLLEGAVIPPGGTLELEEFLMCEGDYSSALARVATGLAANHPPLPFPAPPTGWCSWYAYGPQVDERVILDNLAAIREKMPGLEYIQIDDGYQAAMGDWLIPGAKFPGGLQSLCLRIHELGFEPAIWVAPFIAEGDSVLFREHPDWFVQDENGEPLSSGAVSYPGWRNGPWFMLDGTNPGAQGYLRHVFSTIRRDWRCKYFKMDANMWGCMPHGVRYDKSATCVDAYRAGMRAILEGAGEGCFLLGCNAPMWPSLGTVHGMRLSGDISRDWRTISACAREMFCRNWQNGALWINDPDTIVAQNLAPRGGRKPHEASPEEFRFHAVSIMASGGMVLSGDNVMEMTPESVAAVLAVVPPCGVAAEFDDFTHRIGRVRLPDRMILVALNWSDEVGEVRFALDGCYAINEYFSGRRLSDHVHGNITIRDMKPHSALAWVCYPTEDHGHHHHE